MKVISPASRSQREALVATLSEAFYDDPALAWILPDPTERKRKLPYFFRSIVGGNLTNGIALCSETAEAVTLWRTPDRIHPGFFEKLIGFPSLLRAIIGHQQRAQIVGNSLRDHHPSYPHYYLQFAGVAPALQGKGWGGAAIRAGLNRASAAGMPVYLETAKPSNVALYRRLGFDIVNEWDVPGGGPHFWAMLWKPA